MAWVGICHVFWQAVYEAISSGSSAGCAAGIEMDLTALAFKAMIMPHQTHDQRAG